MWAFLSCSFARVFTSEPHAHDPVAVPGLMRCAGVDVKS
ncbi:hypothetical protein BLL52_0687 [Rhodoferax antarcticus ANT.BR]|uniref:Uncharacterized protein n=1 Tax=Rhodoferax antarcticus ANT.BR TaxID=1111071 RepID=A0A1Q8YJ26_9BURK|nr:hypothetical protein BLL52_0687 [Rhodoferax antarcticus ANT.BR]